MKFDYYNKVIELTIEWYSGEEIYIGNIWERYRGETGEDMYLFKDLENNFHHFPIGRVRHIQIYKTFKN